MIRRAARSVLVPLAVIALTACPRAATRPRADDAHRARKGEDAAGAHVTDSRPARFIEGPSSSGGPALLAWLEQNARRPDGTKRRFRLPVVARFDDEHRLAIASASVGTRLASPPGIALALDDTGLSIALLDTLRARCPAGAPGCAIWLDGYFAPLIDEPMPEMGLPDPDGRKRWPFAVLAVGALVGEGDAGQALVEE